MAKKSGPYIGITGFMALHEVVAAHGHMSRASTHRLMVGVLMSSKTLAGQRNSHPGRYPRREAVAGIFVSETRVLNLVHYHPEDPTTLVDDAQRIVTLAGPRLDGFQFNTPWPDPSRIAAIRHMFPELFIVLQVGPAAMERISLIRNGCMKEFTLALARYGPSIDAVLIDPSGGTGTLFDPQEAARWLRAAREVPGLEIGVAGGLGPHTAHLVKPLIKEFPKLNIDAEGRLRTQPSDALDLLAVKTYLAGAHSALGGTSKNPF
jgi:hypothetical protein